MVLYRACMTQRQLHYQENDTRGDNDSQELSAQLACDSPGRICSCLYNLRERGSVNPLSSHYPVLPDRDDSCVWDTVFPT